MRRFVRIILVAVALVAAAAVAIRFLVDANSFRPMLEAKLSQALGREVHVGDLQLSLLSGGVTASDLSIADDPAYAKTPFVQAKSLKVQVELWPLITSKKLNVTGIVLDQPQIRLTQAASGAWNFSNLGAKPANAQPAAPPATDSGKPMAFAVHLIRISGGQFVVAKSGRSKPLVLDPVDAEVHDFSSTTAFPFTMTAKVTGGGAIELKGQAGPLGSTDIADTPLDASLSVNQLNLAGSGWTEFIPGMAGLVSFDGTAKSDGRNAGVNGKLKAEKLKFSAKGTPAARVLELDFAAGHDLKTRAGRLSRGDIHVGAAVAHLTGTYSAAGESPVLHLNLAGPSMPVPELAAMLPALGIALPAGSSLQGGTAGVKLAIEGPAANLVTAGSVALTNATLANFSLGRKMSIIESLAGMKQSPDTQIQNFSANVKMAGGGIDAQQIQLNVPDVGELAGAGQVSPANALDFKMSAKLHTSGAMALVSKETIPFSVTGTCADPAFHADVKSMVSEKAKDVGMKAAGSLLKGILGGKKN
jgi:AsmA protein